MSNTNTPNAAPESPLDGSSTELATPNTGNISDLVGAVATGVALGMQHSLGKKPHETRPWHLPSSEGINYDYKNGVRALGNPETWVSSINERLESDRFDEELHRAQVTGKYATTIRAETCETLPEKSTFFLPLEQAPDYVVGSAAYNKLQDDIDEEASRVARSMPVNSKSRINAIIGDTIRVKETHTVRPPEADHQRVVVLPDGKLRAYILADSGEVAEEPITSFRAGSPKVIPGLDPNTFSRREKRIMRHTQHALGMANTYRQAAHNKEASLYIRRELLHFTDSSAREEYDKLPIDEKAETYLKQISKSSTSSGGETRQLRKIIDEYRWFKKKEDKWMHIAEHGGHHRSIIKPWTWFSFHNYHGHDLRADAELKFMEERARKKTTPSNTPEPPFPYDPAPLAFVHSKP